MYIHSVDLSNERVQKLTYTECNHYKLQFTSTQQLTGPILNTFKDQGIVKKTSS